MNCYMKRNKGLISCAVTTHMFSNMQKGFLMKLIINMYMWSNAICNACKNIGNEFTEATFNKSFKT